MKRFFLLALGSGVPFGLVMAVVGHFTVGSGLGVGLGAGLLFGVGMAATMLGISRFMARNPPEVPGESVVFRTPANHFRGAEGVGGWLVLTRERLLFKPHAMNVQRNEWSVQLPDVLHVEGRKTAGLFSNGISVETAAGVERFVVEDRNRWLEELGQRKLLVEES